MEAWGGLEMVALASVVARLVTLSTMETPVLEVDSGCTGLTIEAWRPVYHSPGAEGGPSGWRRPRRTA